MLFKNKSFFKVKFFMLILPISFVVMACGNRVDGFELPELFAAQSAEDFVRIFGELDESHYMSEYEMRELSEGFISLALGEGRPIEHYLEDFDYLVDKMGVIPSYVANLIRYGIENFFHMNDFIFHILLIGTAYTSGVFDDFEVEELPFVPLPALQVLGQERWTHLSNYSLTPNGILVLVYDLK